MIFEKIKLKEFQFKDIMRGFYDGPHATPTPSDEGAIFLGIKNIKENGGIDFTDIRYISEEEFPKWTKRVVPQKDDIVFSYEATLHRYALIPEDFRGCLGRRMALVRVDKSKVSEKYLYYHFLSPDWKGFIETIKISGATVDRISITDFPNYKISLPALPTQQKIAAHLSAYDELIENNNQRIKLLESMAAEIYKEWFVRLRFPGFETVEIVDGLPIGWSRVKIGDTLESIKRKPKISADKYLSEGLFPIIDQSDDEIAGYTNDYDLVQTENLPMLVFGDHTRRVKFIDKPFASGADGTQLLYPKNKNLLPIYFFIAVKNIDLSNFHYARHFKFLKQEYIVIPDDKTLSKFNILTISFFNEIDILKQKNAQLQQTRDLLLPRLISGKLEV